MKLIFHISKDGAGVVNVSLMPVVFVQNLQYCQGLI
jgi:hypothetical protein